MCLAHVGPTSNLLRKMQPMLLPSGKWPFIVDLSIKNVIFHSYVTLPEGMYPIKLYPFPLI